MGDVLFDILAVYEPSELIYANMGEYMKMVQHYLKGHLSQCTVTAFAVDDSVDYKEQAKSYFEAEAFAAASRAGTCIGILLNYVREVMQSDISHINSLEHIDNERRLVIDAASLRHLEVTQNVRDGGRRGTLLDVLDKTNTAMGGSFFASGLKHRLSASLTLRVAKMPWKTWSSMKSCARIWPTSSTGFTISNAF